MEYYIKYYGQNLGPFTRKQLLWQNLHSYTNVWRKGLEQWTPANKVEELKPVLTLINNMPKCTPPPLPGMPPMAGAASLNGVKPLSPKKAAKIAQAQAELEEEFVLCPKTWRGASLFVIIWSAIIVVLSWIGSLEESGNIGLYLAGCAAAIMFGAVAYLMSGRIVPTYNNKEYAKAESLSKWTNAVMQVGFWLAALMTYMWIYHLFMWPYLNR